MGYTHVNSLNRAITMIAKATGLSKEKVRNILADGKQRIFQTVGEMEIIFIPDNSGFICAVEG